MTPFTELLEHMAKRLPEVGGVCINAESELEAVGMAWGALATGARAATGSTGQGLCLMQESFSEITLAQLPLVIFNMARGQGDYYQSTRGGGHGDYRHIVLAPTDVAEAVELTGLAFELADKWLTPVLVYGDYLIAHTSEAVALDLPAPTPVAKPWAVDGSMNGTGHSRIVSSLGIGKHGNRGDGIQAHHQGIARKLAEIEAAEVRYEAAHIDGAEHVVVAFGTAAKFVRYLVEELRDEGIPIGCFRPITLWPFPYEALTAISSGLKTVVVFEINNGQMIDDVRIAVQGQAPVVPIGGISTDSAGFGVGSLMDVEVIRERLLAVLPGQEAHV
jgi:2-oxoglutarate/2-oxoacid ferredoxin oxidoreductase subunit alpha